MNNSGNTRPFNADHAKTGAPYACKDGCKAEILKFGETSIFGAVIGMSGVEHVVSWDYSGYKTSGIPGDERSLVMTPLGYIDGTGFFVGDEIIGTNGAHFIAEPSDRDGDIRTWRWPAAKPEYPPSTITDTHLGFVWGNACFGRKSPSERFDPQIARAIADAAVALVFEIGDAVPKADHEAALAKVGVERNAARDMVVARAVDAVRHSECVTNSPSRLSLETLIASLG